MDFILRKLKKVALVSTLAVSFGISQSAEIFAVESAIPNELSSNSGMEIQAEGTQPVFKISDLKSNGKEITAVITGETGGNDLIVTRGTLYANDKEYNAASLICSMKNKAATITVTFSCPEIPDKGRMLFTINGEDVMFDLFDNVGGNRSGDGNIGRCNYIGGSKLVINGVSLALPDDMTVYLDGNLLEDFSINKLDPNDISSIYIDRENKTIKITGTR